MFLPADVANQALDAAGIDYTIGDLEEGTRPAQVTLRAYGICLRQLLRACHWDFARVELPLTLLADASGQTANVGTIVPGGWGYLYLYPADCMKLRFIPWNDGNNVEVPVGNIQIPQNVPLTTAPQAPLRGRRIRPSRFVIGTDPNYPSQPGQLFWQAQGESPAGSTVIMSDVRHAHGIYTRFMPYPNTWDSLFRGAFVAYLASEIALPLNKDKKLGMTLRKENIEVAKVKIKEARIVDGNEGISTSDISVDWMRTRRGGGWGGRGFGGYEGGDGSLYNGFDSLALADGSVF
jgi:hypothetical protein